MTVNNELEWLWKETVVAYFSVLTPAPPCRESLLVVGMLAGNQNGYLPNEFKSVTAE
jgi:hypothetical protein